MKWIRQQTLEGKLLAGTFLNLGSSVTAEIAGIVGFDFAVLDLEHGTGDRPQLVSQLQALEASKTAPLVRIQWNDMPTFKRILDLGPSGIMVPYVCTPDEARSAVASMRYPPAGVRGVAPSVRASGYGQNFAEYFETVNEGLLTVVQIETREAVENAAEIAAVDGVDVLFVGPMDLSVSMGIPGQFDNADFRSTLTQVVSAAKKKGKVAGILAQNTQQVASYVDDGFTFVACGADGAHVARGFKEILQSFDALR